MCLKVDSQMFNVVIGYVPVMVGCDLEKKEILEGCR